jgi:hypothetical protein
MTFEELYKYELEHNERLRAAVGVPLGLLVVIGGLLGALLQSVWFEKGVLCVLFWLAALASALFFVQTVYLLARSYHGYTYKAMPFALDMRRYRDGLREWHKLYGAEPDEGDREYEKYLEHQYAEAADHNASQNLAKSEYLFRANAALVRCVILTAVTFVPFAIHRLSSPTVAQKIEIINRPTTVNRDPEIRMPNDKAKPAPQSPPQSPPPKPPAPPLRDLKEGQIPNKK